MKKLTLIFTLAFSATTLAGAGHDGAHWTAPDAAQKLENPFPKTKNNIQAGRSLFQTNCAQCHGEFGEGNGPMAKNLPKPPANLRAMAGQHPDGDFFWKIQHGRGAMPAFKGKLSDEQIWKLVTYIQSLPFTAPQKPSPFDLTHGHSLKEGHH